MPSTDFWARLRQSLGQRPLAFAQVAAAAALVFLVTIQVYNHWQNKQAVLTAQTATAPTVVATAAPERQVQVTYDDSRAEDAPDGSVVMLPAGVTHPRVHFVMDRVDITPRIYAASFNY
jgi:uncharacterized protein YjlB